MIKEIELRWYTHQIDLRWSLEVTALNSIR